MKAVLAVSILTVVAATGSAQTPRPPTVAQVVQRHLNAVGNPTGAARDIQYIKARMTLPDGHTQVESEIWTGSGGRFLKRTRMGKGVIEFGSDGTIGWRIAPRMPAKLLSDTALAALRQPETQQRVERITDTTRVTQRVIEGREVHVVALALPTGRMLQFYDVETGLLTGMDFPDQGPSGPQPMMSFGRYRKVDGIRTPTVMVVRAPNTGAVVTEYQKISYKEIPSSMFDQPRVIRGMLEHKKRHPTMWKP